MKNERNPTQPPLTFEQVAQRAVENLLQNGSHAPTLLIDASRQGAIFVLADLAPTHNARLTQFFLLGSMVATDKDLGRVRQAFLITEAWMSEMRGSDAPVMPPSEDPKRMEVLVVNSVHVSKNEMRIATYQMLRDAEGQLREVKEHIVTAGEKTEAQSALLDAFIAGFGTRRR